MKALIDSNVFLDIALNRPTFYEESVAVFNLPNTQVQKFITSSICTDLYYIIRKAQTKATAKRFLSVVLRSINVLAVPKEVLLKAIESDFKDFEDAVQNFSAEQAGMEAIITRNQKDYQSSSIPVYSPQEFLKIL